MASQALAIDAVNSILSESKSLFQLDDMAVSRMIVCGKCDQSAVDQVRAKEAFRKSINVLADKITKFDEWGPDPERARVSRVKRQGIYRQERGDHIKARDRDRRIDRRIEQLKKEVDHANNT